MAVSAFFQKLRVKGRQIVFGERGCGEGGGVVFSIETA